MALFRMTHMKMRPTQQIAQRALVSPAENTQAVRHASEVSARESQTAVHIKNSRRISIAMTTLKLGGGEFVGWIGTPAHYNIRPYMLFWVPEILVPNL